MNYLKKGMAQDAIREYDWRPDRLAGGIPLTQIQKAQAYAAGGRASESHTILASLIRPERGAVCVAIRTSPRSTSGSPTTIARWTGLTKAFEERSFNMVYLKVHPIYDPLRQDPRFVAMVRKMQF